MRKIVVLDNVFFYKEGAKCVPKQVFGLKFLFHRALFTVSKGQLAFKMSKLLLGHCCETMRALRILTRLPAVENVEKQR